MSNHNKFSNPSELHDAWSDMTAAGYGGVDSEDAPVSQPTEAQPSVEAVSTPAQDELSPLQRGVEAARQAKQLEAWMDSSDMKSMDEMAEYLANRPTEEGAEQSTPESDKKDGDVFDGKSLREIAEVAREAMAADDKSTAEEAKAVIMDRMLKLVDENKIDDDTAQSRLLYLESIMHGDTPESAAHDNAAEADDNREVTTDHEADSVKLDHEAAAAAAAANVAAAKELAETAVATPAEAGEPALDPEAAAKKAEANTGKTAGELLEEARAAGRDVDIVPIESEGDVAEAAADASETPDTQPAEVDTAPVSEAAVVSKFAAAKSWVGGKLRGLSSRRRAARDKRNQEILALANTERAKNGEEALDKAPTWLALAFKVDSPEVKSWNQAKKSLKKAQFTDRGKRVLDTILGNNERSRAAAEKRAQGEPTPISNIDTGEAVVSPADVNATEVIERSETSGEK